MKKIGMFSIVVVMLSSFGAAANDSISEGVSSIVETEEVIREYTLRTKSLVVVDNGKHIFNKSDNTVTLMEPLVRFPDGQTYPLISREENVMGLCALIGMQPLRRVLSSQEKAYLLSDLVFNSTELKESGSVLYLTEDGKFSSVPNISTSGRVDPIFIIKSATCLQE